MVRGTKKAVNLDTKVMNVLFCASKKKEFNRMSTVTSAHQIWHTLQVIHEGKNKIKESKIFILVHRSELFKMKENETIAEMITRFTDITNSLVVLVKNLHPSGNDKKGTSGTYTRMGKEDHCYRRGK